MMLEKKAKYNSVVQTALKYFILIFFAFCNILPLISCLITSLKNTEEYQSTSVMVLPKILYFKNFIDAFKLANMGRAFINSFVVSLFDKVFPFNDSFDKVLLFSFGGSSSFF